MTQDFGASETHPQTQCERNKKINEKFVFHLREEFESRKFLFIDNADVAPSQKHHLFFTAKQLTTEGQ
jgi:hypothetical protein